MDTVYPPSDDSYLMLEALEDFLETADSKTVLDMGTGSGILAIAAAKKGCSVTATDINPDAIETAKENAKKENIKLNFVLSNLFERVEGKFELIIFNPPYVRTEDSEAADMQSIAWQGGTDGMVVIDRFLKQVKAFLKPGGRVLLLVSSMDDRVPPIPGFKTKVLKEKSLFFERLFVFELEPS